MTGLRILFVIPGRGLGNSMIFARRQAGALRREGTQVATFYLRSRTNPAILAMDFLRFRRRLSRFQPDCVHSHFGTVTAAFTALAASGTPLTITFRGSDLNPPPPRASLLERLRTQIGHALSQAAALRAAHVICVSHHLRQRLWWGHEKTTVLASGVDTQVFVPSSLMEARSALGWASDEAVVLFHAGTDSAAKRPDLARAAVVLAQARLARVRMLELDGSTPPERMPQLMNAADVLLVTSDAEGSPTVIQEALATNLPVVSVDCGDAAERLSGVSHCAIVPRSSEAIAAALVDVLEARQRSDGRRKAVEFSSEEIVKRLIEIYISITAQTANRPLRGGILGREA